MITTILGISSGLFFIILGIFYIFFSSMIFSLFLMIVTFLTKIGIPIQNLFDINGILHPIWIFMRFHRVQVGIILIIIGVILGGLALI